MKTTAHIKNEKGFTLIELLVVIGILAILLAITLIAINPARQFAQANNTQRNSDANAILNAVHQFMADNNGNPPAAITGAALNIGSGAGNADLCADLVTTYIADLPIDPATGNRSYTSGDCTAAGATYDTQYEILSNGADSRITVTAPDAELGAVISVTR